MFTALGVNAQNVSSYRVPANPRAIPLPVTKTFYEMYPDVFVRGWYSTHITYWQNDLSAGWYDPWYGPRHVVVYRYEQTTYFEVEFSESPGELSRALFNVHGYWYETRTKIRSLPTNVINALQASQYKDWQVSDLKERIFMQGWPDIYRFKVTKKLRSRIIRIDANGNFVQAKDIE